jgi:hypothetical protein
VAGAAAGRFAEYAIAAEAVRRIADIYAIEATIRGLRSLLAPGLSLAATVT